MIAIGYRTMPNEIISRSVGLMESGHIKSQAHRYYYVIRDIAKYGDFATLELLTQRGCFDDPHTCLKTLVSLCRLEQVDDENTLSVCRHMIDLMRLRTKSMVKDDSINSNDTLNLFVYKDFANITEGSDTLLMNSATAEMTELLVKYGHANVNFRSKTGETALLKAARHDISFSNFRQLVELGADPLICDNRGRTHIHLCFFQFLYKSW